MDAQKFMFRSLAEAQGALACYNAQLQAMRDQAQQPGFKRLISPDKLAFIAAHVKACEAEVDRLEELSRGR